MAEMKRLAKETAIYGVSSILGRFLNWGLGPFYTYVLATEADFGIVSELYAYTALFMVILTYGMETGFFRYANKSEHNPEVVYSTSLISLGFTSTLFVGLVTLCLPWLSSTIGYTDHPEYIWMMAFIVAIDAFSAIPFAWLRFKKRPIMFAALRLMMIFVNIFFNVFFLWICPKIYRSNPALISWFFDPDYGVGYIFIANMISSVFGLIALAPTFIHIKWKMPVKLLKDMLRYSLPLMILGIAGMMNQSLDKMMMKHLYKTVEEGITQLGIYTACFKIGIVMMMFTQAFRYAYEPFVFSKTKDADSKKSYAEAMKYFIIFSALVFLSVMYYLDILQYLISSSYRVGLKVIPVVLLCYIFQGISFNLSFWYKLTDRTNWGAYISYMGLFITVMGNLLFVPKFGYMASAWTSFVCFFITMVVSWWLSQKYYPINYDLKLVGRYVVIGTAFYLIGMNLPIGNLYLRLAFRTVLLLLFVAYVLKRDMAGTNLPFIGKLKFLSRKA
ncbi:MAG: oligosaccharide flippase family protein [Bacteroidota bacterium]|nr:oligosaccharide flippase family protein [Bacteroidota bacterium]